MGSTAQEKTYYELLGVERNATVEEIRASYKEIARVFHPDSNFFSEIIQDAVTTEEVSLFKIITAAYNTLIDQQKRAEYDRTLPCGLRDWESDTAAAGPSMFDPKHGAQYYANLKREKKLNPRSVFGTKPAEEGDDAEEGMTIKSMAQMFHDNSLLGRFKRLLGFR